MKNPVSITVGSFLRIADIAIGAKARRESDTEEFMTFYRELVETLPATACTLFGTLPSVGFTLDDTAGSGGILISVTDFLWWKSRTDRGLTFSDGSQRLKSRMIHRLASKAETSDLTPQERKSLLDMLDPKGTIEGMA